MSMTDIELLFEQAGLKNNQGARLALFLSQAMGRNKLLDKFTKLAMMQVAITQDILPFVGPDQDALAESGFSLGTSVLANSKPGPCIYLPVDAMYRHPHILIAGGSGTGKSWNIVYLCTQLIHSGETIWFVDSEGDFVDMLALVEPGRLWVMRHDELRLNPLEPLPNEDPIAALGRLKTALREATFCREGALNLLSEVAHELYNERGVFAGSQDYPCLEDVYQEVKKSRYRLNSKRGWYAEVLLSRLVNLLENMRPTFYCKRGFPIDDLASHSIVFDLTGLSRDLAHFLVDYLFLWLADWKLRGMRCGS